MYRQEESSIEHTFNMKYFSNLELVCNEMMRINDELDGGYQNNIHAYQFYRLERYIYLLAQNSMSYFEFKDKMKQVINDFPRLIDVRFLNRFRVSNTIRYLIIKNKFWIATYILAKTRYKDKL